MTQLAAMSVETARTVAQDPLTAPSILEELALHEDVEVRQAVARNPNTSLSILFQLGEEFPDEFFNNPVFPLLSLENPDFYQAIPDNTLQNLLVHESVPHSWLEWALTETDDWLFYESLVANPITSRAILEEIVKNSYADLREVAQMHVNYAGEMAEGWHELAAYQVNSWSGEGSVETRAKILVLWELGIISFAQFRQLPTKVKRNILKQTNSRQLIETVLTGKPSKRLRLACAENLSTPADYLTKLSRDKESDVVESALHNPNIPHEVFEKYYRQEFMSEYSNSKSHEISELISCRWWFYRANAARHPNLSLNDLKPFVFDSDFNVRASAASNSNISIELLEKLLQDREANVRVSALRAYQKRYANSNFLIDWETATHPNTSPEKLAELSKSKWLLVREAVAKHPHAAEAFIVAKGEKTALTVLEKLAKDKHQAVRIAVAENPYTLIELLEAIIKANKYNSKACLVAVKHLLERAPDRAEKHLFHYYNQIDIDDVQLRPLILQHPAAPINLLKNKLRLLTWIERYTITQNPKTSCEILEVLAKDANRVVRAAAKERLENM